MLEEMQSFWPEAEYAAENDSSSQKKKDTEALSHSHEERRETPQRSREERTEAPRRSREEFTEALQHSHEERTEALQHSHEECNENHHSEESRAQKEKRAAEHFTRGVLTRGEAAKRQDGELPRGATHEIVETKEGELPKLRRRRYSLV